MVKSRSGDINTTMEVLSLKVRDISSSLLFLPYSIAIQYQSILYSSRRVISGSSFKGIHPPLSSFSQLISVYRLFRQSMDLFLHDETMRQEDELDQWTSTRRILTLMWLHGVLGSECCHQDKRSYVVIPVSIMIVKDVGLPVNCKSQLQGLGSPRELNILYSCYGIGVRQFSGSPFCGVIYRRVLVLPLASNISPSYAICNAVWWGCEDHLLESLFPGSSVGLKRGGGG
jgi:hypothetical protein